ncbi:MAG: M6 family metalloprotease domain-containing protein [Bacteroidetes bacterium]|nr:M6 family metalloprotease domain-containing protein [Bacteroidota bacterium]
MKNIYLKTLSTLLLVILLFPVVSLGAYLRDVPITLVQPNGAVIQCFITGDEFYNYLHDANHYTIVKDANTGYYVYADKSGEELIPTNHIVGESDPGALGLKPGVNISGEKWKQIRETFESNTPKKKPIQGYSASPSESTGTLNNLVIFIRFSDQSDFPQTSTYYDGMFNTSTSGASSMKNYFQEASYNQMNINSSFYPLPSGTVVLSYQDSHPRSYYMPYDATTNPDGYTDLQRTLREHTLLKNATNAVSSQVPSGLNIDYNNDGYVDNVCYIVRGGTTAWSTLLWPHRWSLYSQYVTINGKTVYDYNFQLETFLDSYSVGVLCHEMFHTLGSPDLYHYTSNGISPVGSWDLMENNTNPPQHMGAFMKYKYGGWIASPPSITTPGTYTINSLISSSTNNCYKIASPSSSTEYFVVEFRKKTGIFEGNIPGSGLIIYRINPAASGNASGPPDEVYIYRPGGSPTANGSINSAYFSSESGRTTFNNTTNPYCFLSNGNLGGLSISQVGSSSGNTISFNVNFGMTANFSANVTTMCPNETVTFTDASSPLPTSWTWSFSPNTVTYVSGTTASSQNPQVKFNAAGDYSVTLTATGSDDLDSKFECYG